MTDNTTNTADVIQRLEKLEHQNRRLRFGLLAMALGFGAMFLIAALPPTAQTVRARKFLFVDHTGRTRASLAMNRIGQPEFKLLDASSKVRADLEVNLFGYPSFTLFGPIGKPAIYIGSGLFKPTPTPQISLISSWYGPMLSLGLGGKSGREIALSVINNGFMQ